MKVDTMVEMSIESVKLSPVEILRQRMNSVFKDAETKKTTSALIFFSTSAPMREENIAYIVITEALCTTGGRKDPAKKPVAVPLTHPRYEVRISPAI